MIYEMTVFHRRDYILLLNNKLISLTIKSKAEVVTYPFSFPQLILRNCIETKQSFVD